jgi:hypothetical protein
MTDQAAPAQKPATVWSAGAFAGALAVIANVVILYFAKPLAPALMPLNIAPVVIWTIIGTLGATLVYRFIAGRSAAPGRAFVIVAVIALLISFAPDIALLVNPNPMFGQVTAPGVYSLMAMHVVAAAIIVTTLIRRSR